jgi:hypothetical protein
MERQPAKITGKQLKKWSAEVMEYWSNGIGTAMIFGFSSTPTLQINW